MMGRQRSGDGVQFSGRDLFVGPELFVRAPTGVAASVGQKHRYPGTGIPHSGWWRTYQDDHPERPVQRHPDCTKPARHPRSLVTTMLMVVDFFVLFGHDDLLCEEDR